jgi:hypothetical protein
LPVAARWTIGCQTCPKFRSGFAANPLRLSNENYRFDCWIFFSKVLLFDAHDLNVCQWRNVRRLGRKIFFIGDQAFWLRFTKNLRHSGVICGIQVLDL